MNKLLFSNILFVEIEGSQVLRLVDRFLDHAEYTILGFQNKVILRDFRKNGLMAIDYVLATANVTRFPNDFNGWAHATIIDSTNDAPMIIELIEPGSYTSNYLLWIAVGIELQIPVYEYLFGLVEPLDNHHCAFLGIAVLDEENAEKESNPQSSAISSISSRISTSEMIPSF